MRVLSLSEIHVLNLSFLCFLKNKVSVLMFAMMNSWIDRCSGKLAISREGFRLFLGGTTFPLGEVTPPKNVRSEGFTQSPHSLTS